VKSASTCSLLNRYDQFYIFTHVRPDGDAIGSSLAWGRALRLAGKSVQIFCPGVIPDKYLFLPRAGEIRDRVPDGNGAVPAFVLDCSDLNRLDYMKEKVQELGEIVNIDHHVTNENFGDYNIVDTSSSATAEIIYDLIGECGFKLDREISLCLYAAISSDTGSFKYENTTPRTMRIAGNLLEYNLNPSVVSRKLFDEYPLSTIMLLRDALATLRFEEEQKIAWMSVTAEMIAVNGARPEELESFVNYVRNIEGVAVGILFYHTGNGETKVGLRSNTVDVAAIAWELGGGGHPRASGCTISGDASTVEKKVIDLIKVFISENGTPAVE